MWSDLMCSMFKDQLMLVDELEGWIVGVEAGPQTGRDGKNHRRTDQGDHPVDPFPVLRDREEEDREDRWGEGQEEQEVLVQATPPSPQEGGEGENRQGHRQHVVTNVSGGREAQEIARELD